MEIMNLFVDSNIFLQFYHFSEDDLEELRKLSKLITDDDIRLFVPEQVINEVKRNRDFKVADAYKKFRDSKPEINLPQICKTYSEYNDIKAALANLKKAMSDLDAKLTADITNNTLKADSVIHELFGLASVSRCDSYIEAAKQRFHLGNPPGKNNSYGDAINWESLLDVVPMNEDLFFISDDKDYKSPITQGVFNSFLLEEWKTKKGAAIHFYTQLSEFFRNHHTDIKLRNEEEKNQLIERLAKSGNFASTHFYIEKLSKFDGFTDTQIKQLVEAGISNSQIYWIAQDSDVNCFYRQILDGKEDVLEKDTLILFKKKYFGEDALTDQADEADEDSLPF